MPITRRLPGAALVAGGGVAVFSLLAVSVWSPFADFLSFAVLGLAVAVFAVVAAVVSRSAEGRRNAYAGLGLALTPVLLLAYFLMTSEG